VVREESVLSRDVEVTAIPYGDRLTLTAGTPVVITQALGGVYTLVTMHGYMVRLDGHDADAIGREPVRPPSPEELANRSVQDLAWDALKTCYDPEIPVNIVDLGLVYGCEVEPKPEGGNKVTVRFTLTAPGCGMGDILRMDIDQKLRALPGVSEAAVEVVLDPPWDPSRMSDAARLQLGFM
jgi:probable FeS assembly SUF system protein SufT